MSEAVTIFIPDLDRFPEEPSFPDLSWQHGAEAYPAVGRLDFRYALLDTVKNGIADPPPREEVASALVDDVLRIDIDRAMMDVYALLIDLENRNHWIPGLKGGAGERPIDRIGVRHLCIFEEDTFAIIPVLSEVQEEEVRYIEESVSLSMGLKYLIECRLYKRGEHRTHVAMQVGEAEGHPLPPDVIALLLEESRGIVESFKAFCEASA